MNKTKTIESLQQEYNKLEQSYIRQERLIEELQKAQKTAKQKTSQAVKTTLKEERGRREREADKLKEAASMTAKAASIASASMIGYYLIAEELDLWIISESFTRSEWFQAIATAFLSWLLVQSYRITQ